jgi:hypothetical protein
MRVAWLDAETAQGVQPGVVHDLCSASFHPDVPFSVLLRFT